MPKSPYFNPYTDNLQQQLYRELIDECVNFFGLQTTYIPRQSVAGIDLLLGDDPTKYFQGTYPLQMYVETVNGFEGPGNMFTKFGLVINKEVKLLVANDEFQQMTSGTLGSRPREGDLVYLSPFQALYEITFVQQDKFFYAFGRQQFYGFELMCEEFRYNNETVTTGDPEIDQIVNTNVIGYQANLSQNGNSTYAIDETVYQGASLNTATATAIVLSWNKPKRLLGLKQITGVFMPNLTVTGANSNAQYTLLDLDRMFNVNDPYNNAITIRDEGSVDLDLTEENPLQGNPVTTEGQED